MSSLLTRWNFTQVLALTAALGAAPAAAQEIYRWVDADGVVHFSDSPPVAATAPVTTLVIENEPSPAYDPDEDLYNVAATEQRMQALREELGREREAKRERSARSAPVAQYAEPASYGATFGYPPPYGWPGAQPPGHPPKPPKPPEAEPEPYPTDSLKLPGRSSG